MPQPKTIVAATDFSGNAQRAVGQAAHLAGLWGAKLYLLHVFNDSVWTSLKAAYSPHNWVDADPAVQARAQLSALGRQISQDLAVTVETEVLAGRAAHQIGEFAAACHAGLLVVGEHGENLVGDMLLGSTALKVLEATHIPVLLIRGETTAAYRSILIATDFSPASARAACMALDYFPQVRHELVHAWMVPFEASMRMGGAGDEDIQHYRDREFAIASTGLDTFARDCESRADGKFERLALYGSPATVLLDQADAGACDLIAIGKHGGGSFEEQLLGSVTQNILYHAGCDVLLSP